MSGLSNAVTSPNQAGAAQKSESRNASASTEPSAKVSSAVSSQRRSAAPSTCTQS